MSLLDLASLVLAPTATKEGKVYSAIPDTGDGDMTFTRGSSATRINSAGLIEKERGNLLLQSNTFDTTWTQNGVSVTGGQSGYDGSSDAWLLEANSASGSLRQLVSFSGVVSLSFYAKAGTVDYIRLRFDAGTEVNIWFDLTDGSVGTNTNGIVGSIEDIGSGWYRVTAVANTSSLTQIRVYPTPADAVGGDSGDNIYIQDAMLNEGLVAQSYIETTTSAVYEGITDDVPRVDYSGGGCPSLLLEGQRSNVLTQSEYFGGSYFTKNGASVSQNEIVSPEGVQNASELTEDTSTGNHEITRSITNVVSTSYSISVFAKANTRNWIRLSSGDGGFAYFNLSTGEVGIETNATGNIVPFANDWYRCEISFTANGTNGSATIRIAESDGVTSYTGESKSVYLYGFQYEQGSYPTSYIPTYSVSSTRVADSCSKTGISELIGQSEGTLFYEFNVENISSQTNDPVLVYLKGTGTESYLQLNNTGRLDAVYYTSGATQCRLQKIISEGTHKVAFAYKANDFIMYIDGVFAASDTSGVIGTLNEFGLQYYNSTYFGQQKVKQAILFPTRLTNDQLAELTK